MKHNIRLLTEHAQVLVCIARHPEWTVQKIAKALRTSERQVFRWLNDLQGAGYLTRAKSGRSNRYQLRLDTPLQEDLAGQVTLSDFLALTARRAAAGEGESATVEAHRLAFFVPRLDDRA